MLYPYIVDFYVPARRLVVEVDGGVHDSDVARARDASRASELVRLYRVRVLRIEAALVDANVNAALAIIRAAVA